jgi:2'-5' RNA ligase
MAFMINRKADAANAGIPEKYTQTSKPHITLVSWEDKPEADEWMVNGIANVVQRYIPFGLHVGKASLVGPQWGKHLVVDVEMTTALAEFIADLKKEVPRGRKGKLHLTLAYKVPGDKVPETLAVENFDINRELVFDHFILLKYTVDKKYVELGKFKLGE